MLFYVEASKRSHDMRKEYAEGQLKYITDDYNNFYKSLPLLCKQKIEAAALAAERPDARQPHTARRTVSDCMV